MAPLLIDLRSQWPALKAFLLKAALLCLLFAVLDRAVGHFLRAGLARYYGLDQPAQVLCVGHSHTVLAINKVDLEKRLGVPVAKYAVEGANTPDRDIMIRHYLAARPDSVRVLVYGVDPHTFTSHGLSSASYRLLFPFIDEPAVGSYIESQEKSPLDYWLRRLIKSTRYEELTLSLSVRGHMRNWSNFKRGQVDIARLQQQIERGSFRKIAFDEENIRAFGETLRHVRSRGIRVVLVYFPTVDLINRAEPEKHRKAVELFRSFAQHDPGIRFLDYNAEYEGRHDIFFDPIHLNPSGQELVTARLADDLRRLLKEQAPHMVSARAAR